MQTDFKKFLNSKACFKGLRCHWQIQAVHQHGRCRTLPRSPTQQGWKGRSVAGRSKGSKSSGGAIVGKKRDLGILDPMIFRAELGKILKIRKNTPKIRKNTEKSEKYSENLVKYVKFGQILW